MSLDFDKSSKDFDKSSKDFDIPVFIIHYKKLTDRKEYLDTALKKEGFTKIHWFEDNDRNTMTPDQLALYKYDEDKWYSMNALWKQYDAKPRLLTKPEIACAVTHIEIYKYIIDHDIEHAIVFEDDAILLPDFAKNIKRTINELPPDFDACFLTNAFGWTVNSYKIGHGFLGSLNKNTYSPDKSVYKMSGGKCADSFILSKKGASLLYRDIIPFCLPLDWCHTPIFLKNNMSIYWAEPALTHQGSEDVYKSSVGRNEQTSSEMIPVSGPLYSSYVESSTISDIEAYSQIQGEMLSDKYASLELCAKERLKEFIARIRSGNNYIEQRFGDGECRCMISNTENDHNCDGCFYYKDLGLDLIKSYIYSLNVNNSYIHKWHSHTYNVLNKMEDDYKEYYNPDRKFLFFDLMTHKLQKCTPETEKYSINGLSFKEEQIEFFRTIKFSERKKIYISNVDMVKALVPLLNINYGFIVPDRNNYLQKDTIIHNMKETMEKLEKDSHKNMILLFSAGMFSKILIHKISELFPNHTYIDIGSTFDGLIKASRDFNGTQIYKDILLKCYQN